MKITDNPELSRIILTHLSDLYKIRQKREGIHLSTLIYCLSRSYFDNQSITPIVPTDEEVMLFALGWGLQDVLTPKDTSSPVLEKDGIKYSPDFIFQLADWRVELKTTRMSAKKGDNRDFPETWIEYMKGGLYITQKNTYELSVLYLMGHYCLYPSTKVLMGDLTWRELSNIRVGDVLIGVDEDPAWGKGKRRKMRYSTVLELGPVKLESYILKLTDGRLIIASGEHLWLEVVATSSSHYAPIWTATKDLKVGSILRQIGKPWKVVESYDSGYLAGMLDAEGSVEGMTAKTHGLRVGYTQKAGETFDKVLRLWEHFGIPSEVSSPGEDGMRRIRTPSMEAALRLLGSVRPTRLLNLINLDGIALPQTRSKVEVEEIYPIGVAELIGIGTSTKTLIAEGLVSHNSPPFPSISSYHFEFSDDELYANWDYILARKEVYDKAIVSKTPPQPFKHCKDWECVRCRYKLVCESLKVVSKEE